MKVEVKAGYTTICIVAFVTLLGVVRAIGVGASIEIVTVIIGFGGMIIGQLVLQMRQDRTDKKLNELKEEKRIDEQHEPPKT